MISLLVDTNYRFKVLQDLGFKSCVRNEAGTNWIVLTIGSPEQGYKPSEISDMSEEKFKELVEQYIN